MVLCHGSLFDATCTREKTIGLTGGTSMPASVLIQKGVALALVDAVRRLFARVSTPRLMEAREWPGSMVIVLLSAPAASAINASIRLIHGFLRLFLNHNTASG